MSQTLTGEKRDEAIRQIGDKTRALVNLRYNSHTDQDHGDRAKLIRQLEAEITSLGSQLYPDFQGGDPA